MKITWYDTTHLEQSAIEAWERALKKYEFEEFSALYDPRFGVVNIEIRPDAKIIVGVNITKDMFNDVDDSVVYVIINQLLNHEAD